MSIQWLDPAYLDQASKDWPLLKVVNEMGRANRRFFLFAIQSIGTPNLQVTFYGALNVMSRVTKDYCNRQSANTTSGDINADTNEEVDLISEIMNWVTTISVIVSVIAGVSYIIFELKTMCKTCGRLLDATRTEFHRIRFAELSTLSKWNLVSLRNWGYFNVCIGVSIALCAVWGLVVLLLKVVMEMLVCPDFIWNMPTNISQGLKSGCVPLDHFKDLCDHFSGDWNPASCNIDALAYWANNTL